MNLKAAARLLGVHYQTAYRYVRSGELVAVRVGAGYEVSDAAVELFKARRRRTDAETSPVPRTMSMSTMPPSDGTIRDELRQLLASTTLSTRPIFESVTRFLAESIGDACVLRLLSEDGAWLVLGANYHVDAARRATFAAYAESGMVSVDDASLVDVVRDGRVVRVDFNRFDTARLTIPREFQQYVEDLPIAGYLAAPVLSSNGRVLGVLTVSRESPGRPFKPSDEEVIVEMADWVAAAIDRAGRFSAGWFARQTLHESLEAFFAACPDTPLAEATDVVMDLLDDDVPEAVFEIDGRMITWNEPFAARLGLDPVVFSDEGLSAAPQISCPRVPDLDLWGRLIAGEYDFLDNLSAGCLEACPVITGLHWAVVRRPDATPVLVIATSDPLAEETGDCGSSRCWALCRPSMELLTDSA